MVKFVDEVESFGIAGSHFKLQPIFLVLRNNDRVNL